MFLCFVPLFSLFSLFSYFSFYLPNPPKGGLKVPFRGFRGKNLKSIIYVLCSVFFVVYVSPHPVPPLGGRGAFSHVCGGAEHEQTAAQQQKPQTIAEGLVERLVLTFI